jgi:hypothetical protein
VQDSAARGHKGFQPWSGGLPGPSHIRGDFLPNRSEIDDAVKKSKDIIQRYKQSCSCQQN